MIKNEFRVTTNGTDFRIEKLITRKHFFRFWKTYGEWFPVDKNGIVVMSDNFSPCFPPVCYYSFVDVAREFATEFASAKNVSKNWIPV